VLQVLHEQFDTLTSRTLGSPFSNGSSTHQQQQHHPHTALQQQQQWWWQGVPIRPTVIQIAHELSAIMSYDSVAVMSGGQVVELGNPKVLAAAEGSRFGRLRAQEGH
jgi:hypothetical protein